MPTAVEYAVMKHFHAQNGCGSGPPDLSLLQAHHAAGSSPHGQTQTMGYQLDLPSTAPSGELLLTGPLTVLLMVITVMSALRRRAYRPPKPLE